MSAIVHVTIGSSAATALSASTAVDGDDDVVALCDDLSCGRLAPVERLDTWLEARRAQWWNPNDPEQREPAPELITGVAALARARHVRVWVSTSLSDQLALAFLPQLLRALGTSPARLDLIQFDQSAHANILGLGMLNPQELAAHPAPRALDALELDELASVWAALTAPEPRALLERIGPRLAPLPSLRGALKTLLSRYPDERSGVNAIEARALRWSRAAGPSASRVLAHALASLYDDFVSGAGEPDTVGDTYVFARMLRLGAAALPRRALELGGSRVAYRDTTVGITPFGEAVLDGRANFLDANGIDDWVAGVHLDSRAGRVWVRRGDDLVERRASS